MMERPRKFWDSWEGALMTYPDDVDDELVMGSLSIVQSFMYNLKFPFTDVSHFSQQQAEDGNELGFWKG
jgi:hypothetical protein